MLSEIVPGMSLVSFVNIFFNLTVLHVPVSLAGHFKLVI